MAGDTPSVDDLRNEASSLIDHLDRQSGPERAASETRLRAIHDELGARSTGDDYDPDALAAGASVKQWMQHAQVPTDTTPTAAPKEAQTKTGAGGSAPTPMPTHGGIPTIPFTHDAMDALRESRCKLCTWLRDHPRPSMEADAATRAKWADDRKKLIVDMIIAEEEMLAAVARHWVPYSPEDEQILDGGYQAIHDLRGKFDEIAKNDSTVADYTKRLADIEQIHDGLKQGLTGIKSDQGFKSAKTVNGLVDKVGQLVDQRELEAMTKQAGTAAKPGTSMGLVKNLRGQTANLEKLAKNTSGNVAKMGGKGNFGQAYTGFAGGMYRLLHQETQRALMKVEGTNHELVGEVMKARETLAEAHAQVLERRQGEALKMVNEYLAKDGEPPFQLHSMSETDFANELDGRLQEMHLADSVERNFGTEASKRTTGLPTSKLGRFRKEHGTVFGANEEQELLDWCSKHCPHKKVAAAAPASNKRPLILVGGAVVAVIAIIVGSIVAFGGGDEPATEPETAQPVEDPVVDEPVVEEPVEDEPIVEEPVEDEPIVEEPVVEEPVVEEPPPEPVAVGVGFRACPGTKHSPSDEFADLPSYVWISLLVLAALAVDDGPATMTEPASGTLTLDTPSTGAESIDIAIENGIGRGEVGIGQYAPYEFTPTVFTTTNGTELPVTGGPIAIDVGPAEGPADGCTPPDEMTPEQRAAAEDAIAIDVVPDPANAGTGGNAGDPGGGAAIIVDPDEGAIPPPEDILAPYREFLTRFDAAHRDDDVDSLLAWLSPAVLAIYGEAQCRSYLEGVVGSISELFLVDGRPDSPWTFADTDGGDASAEVTGAFELDVELSIQGADRTVAPLHLVDVGGSTGVVWFTDCGDPLQ